MAVTEEPERNEATDTIVKYRLDTSWMSLTNTEVKSYLKSQFVGLKL